MKALLVVLAIALAAGLGWRFTRQAESQARANVPPGPTSVRVANPTQGAQTLEVALPGSVRAKDQVTLYARSNGFLRALTVDLGDVVKKDQVLARLDAPDLAASLAQVNARLAQATASLAVVKGQHERTRQLASAGNLSAQDVDTSSLRLTAAESEVASTIADHERLSALVSYLTVRAPFEGTITRRYVDDGALVSAERTALFDLASTGALQIDVDVPQWAAAQVHPGLSATVKVGATVIPLKVARTAGALDASLRTLKTELVPDQPSRFLVPGAYVRVTFTVPRIEPALELPGSAIIVRGGATSIGLVGAGDVLRYVPVKVVRELGRSVEVMGELTAASRVALYPPAALADGDVVKPVQSAEKKAAP